MIETNNQEDVDIIKKLLKFPLLLEKSQWKIRFQREFNMSDDAYLFNTNANGPPLFEGGMIHQFTHEFSKPEYWIEEKKGIDVLKKLQTSRILKKMKEKFTIKITELKELNKELREKNKESKQKNKKPQNELIKKNTEQIKLLEIEKKQIKTPKIEIDFDYYRLGWRDVTNETNVRTLLCTIIPKHVFLSYTIPYLRPNYFNGKNFIFI